MSAPNNSKSPTFASNVLTLVTGTTIAQIITILASPIITRLYGPEAFGLVALFTSITGILGVIVCLRYELAIMLPESDEEAANVFGLCVIIVVLISLISIPILLIMQQPLVQFLKAPQLGQFFWLIPLVVFVSGTVLALNYWNTRTKQFHRLSIARVISSCSSTGTQLGMGFFGRASGGALIGASILGQIVSTLVLGIQILKDHLLFFKQNITRKGMAKVFKRYSNFPKYDIWSALLNNISWQIPIFLLSYFFSTTIVGYYSLGMMMIQLPMSLIGGAIAQVFYQRAAAEKSEGNLGSLVENVFKVLVKIGLFPIVILLFVGKDLFIVFFGSQWAVAGVYVQILSVWAFVWFVSSPLSTIVAVLEKQSWGLLLNIEIFSTRLISLIIGGLLGNVFIALLLFSISGFIVYGYLCLKTFEFSNVSKNFIVQTITPILIITIPAGIFLFLLEVLKINSLIIVFFSIVFAVIYYIYLFKRDPIVESLIIQYIMKPTKLRIYDEEKNERE